MNIDRLEDQWLQLKGTLRQQWRRLTDDDIEFIDGKRVNLTGKLQERYGLAKESAERKVEEWMSSLSGTASTNFPEMHIG